MSVVLSRKPGGSGGGGGPPSGPAGGDLSGTYPNPTVDSLYLAYAQITSPVTVTGTSAAAPTDVVSSGAVTYAAERIRISFFAPNVEAGGTANSYVTLALWDGATDLGNIWAIGHSALTFLPLAGCYAERFLTPTAASHTYRIRAFRLTSDGTVSAGAGGTNTTLPAFISVSRAPL